MPLFRKKKSTISDLPEKETSEAQSLTRSSTQQSFATSVANTTHFEAKSVHSHATHNPKEVSYEDTYSIYKQNFDDLMKLVQLDRATSVTMLKSEKDKLDYDAKNKLEFFSKKKDPLAKFFQMKFEFMRKLNKRTNQPKISKLAKSPLGAFTVMVLKKGKTTSIEFLNFAMLLTLSYLRTGSSKMTDNNWINYFVAAYVFESNPGLKKEILEMLKKITEVLLDQSRKRDSDIFNFSSLTSTWFCLEGTYFLHKLIGSPLLNVEKEFKEFKDYFFYQEQTIETNLLDLIKKYASETTRKKHEDAINALFPSQTANENNSKDIGSITQKFGHFSRSNSNSSLSTHTSVSVSAEDEELQQIINRIEKMENKIENMQAELQDMKEILAVRMEARRSKKDSHSNSNNNFRK